MFEKINRRRTRYALANKSMRKAKRFWILALLLFWTTLIIYHRKTLYPKVRTVLEWSPVGSRVDSYNFTATRLEERCQRGTSPLPQGIEPIPNIVHFVIGLTEPDLSFSSFLSITSALRSINPDTLKIHHTGHLNLDNPYMQSLIAHRQVQLVTHDQKKLAMEMHASRHFAHLADMLRLQIIHEEGGIYLDSDMFVLQPFDNLRNTTRNVLLGHEGGNRWGLCNAVIVARPKSLFIKRWLTTYTNFRSGEWNDHSVIIPKRLAEEHPDEVCPLSPHAFFWPSWSKGKIRWMHEDLSPEEVNEVKRRLASANGSLFPGQLAYHGWNHKARKLEKLTEETLRMEDTRFNLMMRPFLRA